MSANLPIIDGTATQQIIKTTEVSGVHTPHHVIGDGTNAAAIKTGPVSSEKGLRVFIGPTDPVSDLPVLVDFDHHQNHEGEAYQYVHYYSGNAATIDLRLVVPAYAVAIRAPHLTLELVCDVTSNLYLYESPTVATAGSAVTTIRNRNRIGTPNTPGLEIRTGATYSATGAELARYITIASARASIASDTSRAEWILKPSTEYLVRLVTASNSGTALLRINWYEDLGV